MRSFSSKTTVALCLAGFTCLIFGGLVTAGGDALTDDIQYINDFYRTYLTRNNTRSIMTSMDPMATCRGGKSTNCPKQADEKYVVEFADGSTLRVDLIALEAMADGNTYDCFNTKRNASTTITQFRPVLADGQTLGAPFHWCGSQYKQAGGVQHDCGHLDVCANMPRGMRFPHLKFGSMLTHAAFSFGQFTNNTEPEGFKIKMSYRRMKFADFHFLPVESHPDTNANVRNVIAKWKNVTGAPEYISYCAPISYNQLLRTQTRCQEVYPACRRNGGCGMFDWQMYQVGGAYGIVRGKEGLMKDFIQKGILPEM
eukprot:Nk52_evm30s239 gene=Nk52_evmTU30s239